MAKRTATRELTDRNWDDEEEPEEAGEFIQASEDVIKNRQIKKAKRRGVTGGTEGGASVFSGFGGFKSTSSTSVTSFSAFTGKSENGSKTDSNNSSKTENGKPETKSESDFLMNLKSLNESVVTWIKQHVEKNPFCILTPIFKDYEKHLEELEKEKKCDRTKTSSDGDKSGDKEKEPLTFGKPEGGLKFPSNGAGGSATKPLSFGSFTSTTSSFGDTASGNGGFSFKTASSENKSGFSFGSLQSANSTQSESTTGGEDEEYVPPTVEVSEVKEDGAYYTKRCKLFYQKEGKWVERGVGNLHLKLVNEKVQLIIRADTNLGNIMLNIMMSEGIPVKKQGKNNVFFVCIPNPPFDPKADETKPVPILLRVKTSEDAEELVAKIEEKRK